MILLMSKEIKKIKMNLFFKKNLKIKFFHKMKKLNLYLVI
jgi:hypothetical protein